MNSTDKNRLPSILPVGTAVVTKVEVKGSGGDVTCPAGAVGVIVRAPVDTQHSYRVRLPGGEEVSLRREGRHERPAAASETQVMEIAVPKLMLRVTDLRTRGCSASS